MFHPMAQGLQVVYTVGMETDAVQQSCAYLNPEYVVRVIPGGGGEGGDATGTTLLKAPWPSAQPSHGAASLNEDGEEKGAEPIFESKF